MPLGSREKYIKGCGAGGMQGGDATLKLKFLHPISHFQKTR